MIKKALVIFMGTLACISVGVSWTKALAIENKSSDKVVFNLQHYNDIKGDSSFLEKSKIEIFPSESYVWKFSDKDFTSKDPIGSLDYSVTGGSVGEFEVKVEKSRIYVDKIGGYWKGNKKLDIQIDYDGNWNHVKK